VDAGAMDEAREEHARSMARAPRRGQTTPAHPEGPLAASARAGTRMGPDDVDIAGGRVYIRPLEIPQ